MGGDPNGVQFATQFVGVEGAVELTPGPRQLAVRQVVLGGKGLELTPFTSPDTLEPFSPAILEFPGRGMDEAEPVVRSIIPTVTTALIPIQPEQMPLKRTYWGCPK